MDLNQVRFHIWMKNWAVRDRDGYREPVFFWTICNHVNTGLPISFRTNYTFIDTCGFFLISVYFNVNDELETAA